MVGKLAGEVNTSGATTESGGSRKTEKTLATADYSPEGCFVGSHRCVE